MKNNIIILLLFVHSSLHAQNVGIGTNTPHTSAMLEVSSVNRGLLMPRMSTANRLAIAAPAEGLLVYDTDIRSGFLYTGQVWRDLAAGSSYWSLTGTNISNNNPGNVGIGIVAGSARLSVSGTTAFFRNSSPSGYIRPMGDTLVLNARAGNAVPAPGTAGGDLLLQYSTSILERVGNVGIGMAHPADKLTVAGDLSLYHSDERFASFKKTGEKDLSINATEGLVFPPPGTSSGNLLLQYSSSVLTRPGNVGIGIASPEGKLHIGSGGATNFIIGNSFTSGGSTALYMGTSASSNGYTYLQGVRSAGAAGGYGVLALNPNGGNLGVGTTSPIEKLHINGGNLVVDNAAPFMYLRANGLTAGYLNASGNNIGLTTTASNNTGVLYLGAKGQGIVSIEPNGQFSVNTGNPGAFRVHPDGRVTVGPKAASGYWFAVGGSMICEELKVQLINNWPDYVFKDDYKLRTLDDLRKYISENNHLPGIPAAAEVEKNGIDVGDMQKRLMEKVEELTLYVLQLQNEIRSLKGTVNNN